MIMVKGMSESFRRVILENKGEFENIRKYNIRKYKTFGKTIKKNSIYQMKKKDIFIFIIQTRKRVRNMSR